MSTPQIALSKEFLEAYSRLPARVQKKTREFTEKLRRDPTARGLNLERIVEAVDDKLRSVRIDQEYRAVVVQPPKGDVYLCVWVDHHDEAYRWARNKRFEVNPTLGSFQLFEVTEPAAPAEVPPGGARKKRESAAPAGLFDSSDDEDLLLAGIPAPLLAAVRAVASDADLDKLAPHLPADGAEMLYLLAAGYSFTEAIEEAERSRSAKPKVDVQDFSAALAHPQSQQTFKVVETERELVEMLDAPLEQWRIFLHPSQRKLVEMHANGPVRVLGGAGTGKTVVLMHRAKHLATRVFAGPDDRILVTTYSKNLALDLRMNLKNLCGDAYERLEVANIHSWAVELMRKHGHAFRPILDTESQRLMTAAVDETAGAELPVGFYLDEWKHVVQPQEVTDRDAYLTARRVGRGTRLSRQQRAEVWRVFVRYRERLAEEGVVEWADIIRETRLFIEKQRIQLPYRAVVADEVQDFTPGDLRLLRVIAPQGPDTLFLVGDGHQRIYVQPTRLGACGIDIRGRARRLKLNYRTTEEIRNRAVAILEGCELDDLDGGRDNLKGYFSLRHGSKPVVQMFPKETQEAEAVARQVKEWLRDTPAEAICLAARTRALVRDRYQTILQAAGIATVIVEKDPESEAKRPGVRLATMHRMKGLEFRRVLLAGVQEGTVPLTVAEAGDDAAASDFELRERCLLYVAATRARDELVVTGYGRRSPFLV
jgi:hypothetical protein